MNIINKMINKFKRITYCTLNKHKLKVLNGEQTLKLILEKKLSIGRFGDGELALMRGESISFQEFDENLARKLRDLRSSDKFLVCVPDIFTKKSLNKKTIKDFDYTFWKNDLKSTMPYWIKYFKDIKILGDANVSRFYMRYKNKNADNHVKLLKQIWEDRDVVFIEGEKSRLGIGNNLFDNCKSIFRIIGPSKNAFQRFEDLIECVRKNVSKDSLIILGLGPTATVLSYELSRLGYQALDMGHVDIEYEWYRMGAKEKVPVKGKYVNEVKDGRNPEDVSDSAYEKQIIEKIL